MKASRVAATLEVAARTLRHWRRCAEQLPDQPPACRGRPCKTSSPEARRAVRRFLNEVSGPAVGLEALRALFPDVPRCVLADELRRYRHVWRRRHRQHGWRLTWLKPGTVWAIDFSVSRYPIDGLFPYLFSVRDLASHRQLAWQPVLAETAEQAIAVLLELFREHGAPLIIKCDNGSAFIAAVFAAMLAERRVLVLYSPPLCPQYNGAIERSHGPLKTYTHVHAVQEQHPYRWTSVNVQRALELANTISRPWGRSDPNPEEVWQARQPIGDDERRHFLAAAAQARAVARADLGLPAVGDLNHADQSRLDRLALERALCALGYLSMRSATRPAKKARRPKRAELTRPARAAASDAPERLSDEKRAVELASATSADTMRETGDAAARSFTPSSPPPPTHVERAKPSWLRRLITPLIHRAKAAMISG